METTPQHFDNAHAYRGCGSSPATPMDAALPWPPELEALCGGEPPSGRRSALATDCHGDWRNHIARRLLHERRIPAVPMAAGLAGRSELHTGGGGDCTHWCEGSEATLFMATSVLNVLAGVISDSS